MLFRSNWYLNMMIINCIHIFQILVNLEFFFFGYMHSNETHTFLMNICTSIEHHSNFLPYLISVITFLLHKLKKEKLVCNWKIIHSKLWVLANLGRWYILQYLCKYGELIGTKNNIVIVLGLEFLNISCLNE